MQRTDIHANSTPTDEFHSSKNNPTKGKGLLGEFAEAPRQAFKPACLRASTGTNQEAGKT